MIVTLTHTIDVPSVQKATALRDKVAETLSEDEDTTVIVSQHARDLSDYRVFGVNVKTKEPFDEVCEAEDEEDAKAKAKKRNRVIVGVEEVRA